MLDQTMDHVLHHPIRSPAKPKDRSVRGYSEVRYLDDKGKEINESLFHARNEKLYAKDNERIFSNINRFGSSILERLSGKY